MGKQRFLEQAREFLWNDLWEISRVKEVVEKLEEVAQKIGCFLNDLLEFDLEYHEGVGIVCVFDFTDLPDEVYDEVSDLRAVIAEEVEKKLEELLKKHKVPPEVLKELWREE